MNHTLINMFCYHTYLWVMIVVPSPHLQDHITYKPILLKYLGIIDFLVVYFYLAETSSNTKLHMIIYCH